MTLITVQTSEDIFICYKFVKFYDGGSCFLPYYYATMELVLCRMKVQVFDLFTTL